MSLKEREDGERDALYRKHEAERALLAAVLTCDELPASLQDAAAEARRRRDEWEAAKAAVTTYRTETRR